MKKPFFPSSSPGALGASYEANLQGNFDATNAVTDASCDPICEPRGVRSESASEVNTLSTLGENPEPPEAYSTYAHCAFEWYIDVPSTILHLHIHLPHDAPDSLVLLCDKLYDDYLKWSQSQPPLL